MHKDLKKYAGSAAFIGFATTSDSWLLAPDFCSDAERSRNLADSRALDSLSRDFGRQQSGSRHGGLAKWPLALAGSEAVRVRPLAEQAIFPNEAGMLLIAGHFYFWNTVKAGMFMKTQDLFR
jgi:hypothetical protein